MAKCIERESDLFSLYLVCFDTTANYHPDFSYLIHSSKCSFKTTASLTNTHSIMVMQMPRSFFSIAHLSSPCYSPQESDEKASHSTSSSVRVTCPHDREDGRKREPRQRYAKSRANNHAGVDFATPTDAKWIHPSPESDSAPVEASGRLHDNGQSNFWDQVHPVYSILTKFFFLSPNAGNFFLRPSHFRVQR